MTDDFFFDSDFFRWCRDHRDCTVEQREGLRSEAIAQLVASVNAGQFTGLDGIDSPLSVQIKAHHNLAEMEMNTNWIGSSQNWACPCCRRSKFAVSRPGKQNQILAKLVVHHDHMGEALKDAFHGAFKEAGTDSAQIDGWKLVERMSSAFAAYAEVLVCEDCNNADTAAKKLIAAPKFFSFSIGQIAQFIDPKSHQPHALNEAAAVRVWQEVRQAYELRMDLIRTVAHAAATDSHWYEPHPRMMQPIPVLGQRRTSYDTSLLAWVGSEQAFNALGQAKNVASRTRDLSGWRRRSRKPGPALPRNYLAILMSEESFESSWKSVGDSWCCPICSRSKHELTYVAEKGRVTFSLHSHFGRDEWVAASKFCNHCFSILQSLKLELREITGVELRSVYDLMTPAELTGILRPRAHSAHNVAVDRAEALVSVLAQRIHAREWAVGD